MQSRCCGTACTRRRSSTATSGQGTRCALVCTHAWRGGALLCRMLQGMTHACSAELSCIHAYMQLARFVMFVSAKQSSTKHPDAYPLCKRRHFLRSVPARSACAWDKPVPAACTLRSYAVATDRYANACAARLASSTCGHSRQCMRAHPLALPFWAWFWHRPWRSSSRWCCRAPRTSTCVTRRR